MAIKKIVTILVILAALAGGNSCFFRDNPDNKSIGLKSGSDDGAGDRTNTTLYQNRDLSK